MSAASDAYGGRGFEVERHRRSTCAVWLASQCDGWSASCICRPAPGGHRQQLGHTRLVVPPQSVDEPDADESGVGSPAVADTAGAGSPS